MLPPDLINRFTTHLKEALQHALSFSVANGRNIVEPGDVIVGLLNQKGSVGTELLTKAGCTVEAAEARFRGSPSNATPEIAIDLSPGVKQLIEKAILTAHLHEHKYVGTEHLLAVLLSSEDTLIRGFFAKHIKGLPALREQIAQLLKSTSRFPDLAAQQEEFDEPEELPGIPPGAPRPPAPPQRSRASALETFAQELTKPDCAETLDPVIGRDRELERVIEILCRRTKNNPILLGDPGVGKTAIVEGLAQRLASGDVPDRLYGKRILSLDLALTVAGTMYRGEFEARLKQIVEEAKNDPDVLLFIDEIHTIVGTGSTTGSLDAANILKPALSRGQIRCIGATTWAEYKKHIEPDAALERRFQPVTVEEPGREATHRMLQGLEKKYATHHGVRYAPGTLQTAVDLAHRYLTDRLFPDKAIDVIDEAAAAVVARRQSKETMERLTGLDLALDVADEAKCTAVHEGRFEDADREAQEITRLEEERAALEKEFRAADRKHLPTVTNDDLIEVVARMANVSAELIHASERERLASLEERLTKRIVGQDAAITAVADIVRRSRLGLGDPRRPKAAMLFVGPSGTGKTELARTLAAELFGREDALIKIDMSEFSEGHTVSKLIGSPAGYVGYREGSKLTDAVRKRPHAVVLFDEFEKAHPDIQHLLLQILEDGRVTDGTGRSISFLHTYIILTSNVGSDQLGKKSLGFSSASNTQDALHAVIKQDLSDRFRPELLNRLDRVVVFNPLAREHLKEIVRRELEETLLRVEKSQRVACAAGDDVLEWLMSQPLPPEEGARSVRRLIEREITALVSKLLTEQPKKRKMNVRAKAQRLTIN